MTISVWFFTAAFLLVAGYRFGSRRMARRVQEAALWNEVQDQTRNFLLATEAAAVELPSLVTDTPSFLWNTVTRRVRWSMERAAEMVQNKWSFCASLEIDTNFSYTDKFVFEIVATRVCGYEINQDGTVEAPTWCDECADRGFAEHSACTPANPELEALENEGVLERIFSTIWVYRVNREKIRQIVNEHLPKKD